MKRIKSGLVITACFGLVMAGVATSQLNLISPAFADKGGNGNGGNGGGNGNGGGHGNGGGSGKGSSGTHGKSSTGHTSAASAHDKMKVEHDKSKAQRASIDKTRPQKTPAIVDVTDEDIDANTLGPLNAAHASERARERAAPNSSVGKIATYERNREAALAISDPNLRDQALDDAVTQLESDFGRTLTDDQVDQVNALLDARR